jgi:hypothetical protein
MLNLCGRSSCRTGGAASAILLATGISAHRHAEQIVEGEAS